MNTSTNSLNWFDIPVNDMPRAKHFYQVIFSMHMDEQSMGDMQMALFPYEPGSGKASGALVKSQWHQPSENGPVIYLNANPNMDSVLERIDREGGRVLMSKTQITPEIGYMAFFMDTEGNRVALHSQQ